jgi:toxin-antitoxin system PIN domain toxin
VIIIDANLLIYAYDVTSPFHDASRRWLEDTFSSHEEIGLPYQSVFAFLRVMTHPKLRASPVSLQLATRVVDEWLRTPGVWLITPGIGHWTTFSRLCHAAQATGNLITDVHIATIAMEANATLYSADRDFARIPGLRWVNPLLANSPGI